MEVLGPKCNERSGTLNPSETRAEILAGEEIDEFGERKLLDIFDRPCRGLSPVKACLLRISRAYGYFEVS